MKLVFARGIMILIGMTLFNVGKGGQRIGSMWVREVTGYSGGMMPSD